MVWEAAGVVLTVGGGLDDVVGKGHARDGVVVAAADRADGETVPTGAGAA